MSFTSGNDINILQGADSQIVGAGAGDDRYVLDASTLNPNQRITISDTQGQNTLQLAGGLIIVSSLVANDALQLLLVNGAVITILNAKNFYFQTGGNPLNGDKGSSQTYTDFAYFGLGVNIPASGTAPAAGGMKTVFDWGGTRSTLQLSSMEAYQEDSLPLVGVFTLPDLL